MKIRFDKFDKGVFYLEYMDEDLLNDPLEVKLISYSPSNIIKNPFNIKVNLPALVGVDKSILSNFIDIKLPENMSDDEIKYMLSNVTITTGSGSEIKDDSEYTSSDIVYHKIIDPMDLYSFICKIEGIDKVFLDTVGSVKFSMNGLDLKFVLMNYRITLFSTFNIIGKSNSLLNYYFEIISKYIDIRLRELNMFS